MKLFTKKLLIPAAIAASVVAAVPAFVSGDFDLTGLNSQVQNHETRITTLEQATPSPTPTPEVIIERSGSSSAQSPQASVAPAALVIGSAEAPAPSPTPEPAPVFITGAVAIPSSDLLYRSGDNQPYYRGAICKIITTENSGQAYFTTRDIYVNDSSTLGWGFYQNRCTGLIGQPLSSLSGQVVNGG